MNSDLPLIDEEQINALKELSEPGEPDLLSELVDMFLNQSKETIALIEEGIKERNFQKIERTAHKLKGSGANLGAESLRGLCETLEKMGRESNEDGIDALFSNIKNTYVLVCQRLLEIQKG